MNACTPAEIALAPPAPPRRRHCAFCNGPRRERVPQDLRFEGADYPACARCIEKATRGGALSPSYTLPKRSAGKRTYHHRVRVGAGDLAQWRPARGIRRVVRVVTLGEGESVVELRGARGRAVCVVRTTLLFPLPNPYCARCGDGSRSAGVLCEPCARSQSVGNVVVQSELNVARRAANA